MQNPKGKLSHSIIDQLKSQDTKDSNEDFWKILQESSVMNNYENSWIRGTYYWYIPPVYLGQGPLNGSFGHYKDLVLNLWTSLSLTRIDISLPKVKDKWGIRRGRNPTILRIKGLMFVKISPRFLLPKMWPLLV